MPWASTWPRRLWWTCAFPVCTQWQSDVATSAGASSDFRGTARCLCSMTRLPMRSRAPTGWRWLRNSAWPGIWKTARRASGSGLGLGHTAVTGWTSSLPHHSLPGRAYLAGRGTRPPSIGASALWEYAVIEYAGLPVTPKSLDRHCYSTADNYRALVFCQGGAPLPSTCVRSTKRCAKSTTNIRVVRFTP